MTAVLEIERAKEQVRVLPRWYTNIKIEDSPRGKLMDRVRTALLGWEHGEEIEEVSYGCVSVLLRSGTYLRSLVGHLESRGLVMYGNNLSPWLDVAERKPEYYRGIAMFVDDQENL